MAPTPVNNTHTTTINMSNPNTAALALAIRNRQSNSTSYGRTVHIGKDMQPINLPKMHSVNSHAWQKAASFGTLFETVSNLVDAHSVADIISLVSNELPIDSSSSYQEAQAASKVITDSALNVNNLEPLAFLTSTGATVSMAEFDDLKKRPADVTFVRLRCNLNGTAVDNRVDRISELSFVFCLKLPLYEYDTNTNVATRVHAPTAPKGNANMSTSRSLANCFNASGTSTSADGTSDTSTPSSPSGSVTASSFSSPAMKNFMSSRTSSTSNKRGYYGSCDFLDSQIGFTAAFGSCPAIVPENPNSSNYANCGKILREFGESCKLDIFLYLCRLNYVGHDKIDVTMNTQEVCTQISELQQSYVYNGNSNVDTPEELFNKFTSLTVNLPDNAVTWSIQLCSTYFAALTKDLVENMTADTSFKMPDLTTLTTKALQLGALRDVRNQATKSFKNLAKQKDLMTKMFNSLQSSHTRGSMNFQSGVNFPHNSTDYGSNLQYQQSQSSAESTIRRYNDDRVPNQYRSGSKVETRLCQSTGKQHPYDRENNYISRFPLDFKGCFNCGKSDHFNTRDCPLAQSGDFDKKTFFSEMWAHKPHTKDQKGIRRQSSSHSHYGPGNSTNNSNNQGQNFNMNYGQDPNYNSFNYNSNHNYNSNQNSNSNQNYNSFRNNQMSNLNNTLNPNAMGNEGLSHHNGTKIKDGKIDTNDVSSHQINNNGGGRNIDNTPAWLKIKESPSKKARMFTLNGTLLNVGATSDLRPMPLALDNGLPAAVLRFGTSVEDEIPFSCHLDSCAAMNTGNLHLHQWIITQHPHLVESYEQYDDEHPFRPITLDCAVPQSEAEKTTGKLTAVVKYKTRYVDKDNNPLTLSFGLGAAIRVNAIIGLPTFKEWKIILDVDSKRASSKVLNCYFDLCFQHAAMGFPQGVTFDPSTFIRPHRPTTTGLSLLARAAVLSKATTTQQLIIDTDESANSNEK